MNATPVLLILFALSTCYGGTQDDSPTIGIVSPTKAHKVDSSLKVSCPEPTDIAPCVCTTSEFLVMDCSDVQDEDQLRMAFAAFFPTTIFDSFYMRGNNGLKVLQDGVFGGISFEEVSIYNSVLETVRFNSLTSSLSRLKTIVIDDCHLAEFPFEELESFNSLETLNLTSNNISTLPSLASFNLRKLDLSHNPISHLSGGVFQGLEDVSEISLAGCSLTQILPRTFAGIGDLTKLTLSNNSISYLRSSTFRFTYTYDNSLFLDNNNIDYVEDDAIYTSRGFSTLDLSNNAISRLDERVWKSVLDDSDEVILTGNRLLCGCDVDWIAGEYSVYHKIEHDEGCPDGTPLSDLDPEDFWVCL